MCEIGLKNFEGRRLHCAKANSNLQTAMMPTPSWMAVALGLMAAVASVGCGTGRTSHWEASTPAAAAAPQAPAPGGPDHVAAAEAAWARRGDRAQLEQAIAHWEAAVAARPAAA